MSDALLDIINGRTPTPEQRAVAEAKARATLIARAARLGYILTITRDDREQPLYIVTRDALCRAMTTAEEVDAWIKLAGGPDA